MGIAHGKNELLVEATGNHWSLKTAHISGNCCKVFASILAEYKWKMFFSEA